MSQLNRGVDSGMNLRSGDRDMGGQQDTRLGKGGADDQKVGHWGSTRSGGGDGWLSNWGVGGGLDNMNMGMGMDMSMPRMDIIDQSTNYLVTAEVPGLNKNEIDINIDNGMLTVRGEHKQQYKDQDPNGSYIRMERKYGKFERSLRLPADIDESGVKANYLNGILHVTLPKIQIDPKMKNQRRINVD